MKLYTWNIPEISNFLKFDRYMSWIFHTYDTIQIPDVTTTMAQSNQMKHRIKYRMLHCIRSESENIHVQIKTFAIAYEDQHAISYAMMYHHRLYDIERLDVRYWRSLCRTYTTHDIQVVYRCRTISYVYNVVRHDVQHRSPTSELYDIVRLTYDIVRWQESRCMQSHQRHAPKMVQLELGWTVTEMT